MWGQVPHYGKSLQRRGDHPHACGDKVIPSSFCTSVNGSSPRVWGQVQFQTAESRRLRIIPTRVGTSAVIYCNSRRGNNHPHACGDKRHRTGHHKPARGSSPRVWGQAFCAIINISCAGIIPTRVGTRKIKRLSF